MPTTTPTHPNGQPTVMVAVEVVLLWPRGVGGPTAAADAGLWPVFAVVLGDREPPVEPDVAPLFDLLDGPDRATRIAVVDGRCEWTVLNRERALLKLTVHAHAPVRFDATIILPAGPVLGILDVLARGASIAITTRRHTSRLTDRVDIREALTELVLLCCPPSSELAALARILHDAQADSQPAH